MLIFKSPHNSNKKWSLLGSFRRCLIIHITKDHSCLKAPILGTLQQLKKLTFQLIFQLLPPKCHLNCHLWCTTIYQVYFYLLMNSLFFSINLLPTHIILYHLLRFYLKSTIKHNEMMKS